MSAYKELTKLSDINGGAVDEIFARNLAQVISNIADPATDAKAKRSMITRKLKQLGCKLPIYC